MSAKKKGTWLVNIHNATIQNKGGTSPFRKVVWHTTILNGGATPTLQNGTTIQNGGGPTTHGGAHHSIVTSGTLG